MTWRDSLDLLSSYGRLLHNALPYGIKGVASGVLGSGEKSSKASITLHVWLLLTMVDSKKDVADEIKTWGNVCT